MASGRRTVLLIGASRGLGAAMTEGLAQRDWNVVCTVRGSGQTPVHEYAARLADHIKIEQLDVTQADQIASLSQRLSQHAKFDMLFVNAGIASTNWNHTSAQTSDQEFTDIMLTNVLGVMRAVEGLQSLVKPDGMIGVMTSGQGSITNNERGDNDIYRCSKSALNQLMKGYAARHGHEARSHVLLAPGWIRTELGGLKAPVGVEEAMPQLLDTLLAQQGNRGLQYIDRFGKAVPW